MPLETTRTVQGSACNTVITDQDLTLGPGGLGLTSAAAANTDTPGAAQRGRGCADKPRGRPAHTHSCVRTAHSHGTLPLARSCAPFVRAAETPFPRSWGPHLLWGLEGGGRAAARPAADSPLPGWAKPPHCPRTGRLFTLLCPSGTKGGGGGVHGQDTHWLLHWPWAQQHGSPGDQTPGQSGPSTASCPPPPTLFPEPDKAARSCSGPVPSLSRGPASAQRLKGSAGDCSGLYLSRGSLLGPAASPLPPPGRQVPLVRSQ